MTDGRGAAEWDTFGLFEWLLDNFAECVSGARSMQTPNEGDTDEIKTAIVGFGQFSPPEDWNYSHWRIINGRLQEELSAETLAEYEECADMFRLFACLALGALLGKYAAQQIDDRGFLLGDAHLPGFMEMNLTKICENHPD